MQTLVIAHAAFGHNHFFKNNYLFKQWTDADGILDYLDFAKGYIARCEERMARRRGADARRRARADVARRRPLSRQESSTCAGGKTRQRAPRARGADRSTICGAPCRRAARAPHCERGARGARARPAAGQPAVFPGEIRTAPADLAARDPAHRPAHRAIFLSAATDQGDERGHGHLCALPHHDRLHETGQISATATSWNSCNRTPTSCSSRPLTIRASRASTPMRSASR
jgi:hypothetical protein